MRSRIQQLTGGEITTDAMQSQIAIVAKPKLITEDFEVTHGAGTRTTAIKPASKYFLVSSHHL